MDFSAEKLTAEFLSQSAQAVYDRVRTAKEKENKDEVIKNLEDIIYELIEDKNQLIQIKQTYEEQLIMQKMSKEDIEYITNSIVPLLEKLLEQSEEVDAEKLKEHIETLKPILSEETFNILQMCGFNFKQAIGEPLTKLVSALISSKIPSAERSPELRMLEQQREIEYLKMIQDEEAYQRFLDEIRARERKGRE